MLYNLFTFYSYFVFCSGISISLLHIGRLDLTFEDDKSPQKNPEKISGFVFERRFKSPDIVRSFKCQ